VVVAVVAAVLAIAGGRAIDDAAAERGGRTGARLTGGAINFGLGGVLAAAAGVAAGTAVIGLVAGAEAAAAGALFLLAAAADPAALVSDDAAMAVSGKSS